MYNIMDIVRYFMNKDYFTNKQIQKMLYYAYGWYLAKNNTSDNFEMKLFDSRIEAWIHGPVCPDAYFPILHSSYIELKQQYDNSAINIDDQLFLDKIIKIYGRHTGDELEKMTHAELPWQRARGDLPDDQPSRNLLNDKDIYNFFNAYIA